MPVETIETVVDLLRARAAGPRGATGYTFLRDGEDVEDERSYAALDVRARAIAAALQARCAPGDRALLLYPPGLEYIAAFFGCLYAGVIAVPAYPPRPGRHVRTDARVVGIAADSEPRAILAPSDQAAGLADDTKENPLDGALARAHWLSTGEIDDDAALDWRPPALSSSSVAFLQYTSGSTSSPKGVIVSHGNLLANERMIQVACHHTEASTFVGWLPLYHDMGLIGNVLQPLFIGARCVLMSPAAFLQRPLRWLAAISAYRAHTSGGPNFAYELCAAKIPVEQRAALDLRSWEVAFNGAEPVHQETIDRFTRTFASCGFRKSAFFPCYGLAEVTLIASGRRSAREPRVLRPSNGALEQHRVSFDPAAPGRPVVSCGPPVGDTSIAIVDPETGRRRASDRVGEIWLAGPSVARGYWRQPETSAQVFGSELDGMRHLRTGDLGFLHDGELFVTGRARDVIIVRGRNHYAEDLEWTAQHALAAAGYGACLVAAFAIETAPVGQVEQVAIAIEADPRHAPPIDEMAAHVRRAIAEQHGLAVDAVVQVKRGGIPRTSSGKIRRRACRQAYGDGSVDAIGISALSASAEAGGGETALPDVPAVPVDLPSGVDRVRAFERYLSAVAHHVLGRAVTLDAPLVAQGVDSLSALLLKNRIESDTGASAALDELLGPEPMRELAASLAARDVSTLVREDPPRADAPPPGHAPFALSRGQQALWFLDQLPTEGRPYQITRLVTLPADVRIEALRAAWGDVAHHRAMLRARVGVRRGRPEQAIAESPGECFQSIDATAWSSTEIDAHISEAAAMRLDPMRGPMYRVHVYDTGGSRLMLVSVHHLVTDLWSLGLLLEDLAAFYAQRSSAAPPESREIDAGYPEYIAWQERMLAGEEGERLRGYWKDALAGSPPAAALAADLPAAATRRARGRRLTFRFDAALTERIRVFCLAERVTLHALLVSALQIVLWRYGGAADSVIGTLTAGRDRRAFEHAVGYFANPVPVRTTLSPSDSFRDTIRSTGRSVVNALAHQALPLAALVEAIGPARESSRPPLFDILFAFQKVDARRERELTALGLNLPGAALRFGPLDMTLTGWSPGSSQFDLTVMMGLIDDELAGTIELDTDLFTDARIERMAGHMRTLIASGVSSPGARIADLAMTPDAERDPLRETWNATATDYPAGTIDASIRAQARATPDRVAAQAGEHHLSYEALDARARALARRLRSSYGIGPESRVALCLDRGLDFVTGALAVLYAGGAYLPIDPADPAERLAWMLDRAGATVVISSPAAAATSCGRRDVLALDHRAFDSGADRAADDGDASMHPGAGDSERAAYVIFTSGSTGRPKGAINTHGALANRLRWMQDAYRLHADDRVLHKTPTTFDVSVWEYLWPLMTGAAVVIAEPSGHRDPGYLARLIANEQITTLHFVPSMLDVFVPYAERESMPSLRRVVCSGEALPAALCRRAIDALRAPLFNLYGPTEAAIDVSAQACDAEWSGPTIPIGRPIANVALHVLGREPREVPAGGEGELHIAGVALARGYVDQPALTAERFVPNPFSDRGERMYRTGDRVRRLESGAIEFLGRVDRQVKVRGHRIEPREIELLMEQSGLVTRAVVVASRNTPADDRLVAYVSPAGGDAKTPGEVWTYLCERLPAYMRPAWIVRIETWPLTPHGKVDVQALPPVDAQRPEWLSVFAAARDELEDAMAAAWARGLGVRQVGIHDNFFELGGHSLLATQIVWQIQDLLPEDAPLLQAFFENPTVAGLAEAVRQRATGDVLPAVVQRLGTTEIHAA